MTDQTLQEWLRAQCNRHVNGACTTARCLRRGGWVPGGSQSADDATCEAHEAADALDAKDAEMERLKEHITNMAYIPLRYKDRPPGFVEARRKICPTPDVCFEFSDRAPLCGPCDTAAVRTLLKEKA